MSKIIGLDTAYTTAVEKRGMNMVISANLVSEMVDRIRELEAAKDEPLSHAKSLALYLEDNIGSKYSCLSDDLADFIADMEVVK
jgi:hypothetical protein